MRKADSYSDFVFFAGFLGLFVVICTSLILLSTSFFLSQLLRGTSSEEHGFSSLHIGTEPVETKRKVIHRIIAAGDGHWYDHHISTEHPRLGKWANNIHYTDRHEMMISWLNEEADSNQLDLIVFNGDLVTNRPKFLPTVKREFQKLKAPYVVTHGNHDHSTPENWERLWGYGMNHSFSLDDDYAVILLNSSNESGDYLCADHEWLSNELLRYRDKTGVFVFCHIYQHRIDPAVEDGLDNATVDKDENLGLRAGITCDEVTRVMLDAPNIKMAVYSHTHRVDGYYPIVEDGKTLHTFFTGHFSAWGLPYLGYRVIEIYDNGDVDTYMYDPKEKTMKNHTALKSSGIGYPF